MNKHNVQFAVIGILIGFIAGFMFANNINRKGRNQSSVSQAAASRPSQPSSTNNAGDADSARSSQATLSDAEIREAIAKADARPEDISIQRDFGTALYRYANQTQNASYLPDAARFLKRAVDANPNDRDTLVALGNVLFDIGQTSDREKFIEARTYYLKALEIKPDDANVRTDLGLTYYFVEPSEPQKAIAEYRKSLKIDPRHEPTLQNLATALISLGEREEAGKIIEELQQTNPSNAALTNLRAQLAQSKNAARE